MHDPFLDGGDVRATCGSGVRPDLRHLPPTARVYSLLIHRSGARCSPGARVLARLGPEELLESPGAGEGGDVVVKDGGAAGDGVVGEATAAEALVDRRPAEGGSVRGHVLAAVAAGVTGNGAGRDERVLGEDVRRRSGTQSSGCLASLSAQAPPPTGARRASALRAQARDGVRDAGMATAEYAVATLAACGFAGLLLVLLTGGEVRGLLLSIVKRALTIE